MKVKTAYAYLRDALLKGRTPGLRLSLHSVSKTEGDLLVTSDKRQSEVGTKYVRVIYVE